MIRDEVLNNVTTNVNSFNSPTKQFRHQCANVTSNDVANTDLMSCVWSLLIRALYTLSCVNLQIKGVRMILKATSMCNINV